MRTTPTPEGICQQIARLIGEERLKKKLSKSALSDASGLSRRMIGFVETGERKPTLDTLLRITEALGLSLEELISQARRAAKEKED